VGGVGCWTSLKNSKKGVPLSYYLSIINSSFIIFASLCPSFMFFFYIQHHTVPKKLAISMVTKQCRNLRSLSPSTFRLISAWQQTNCLSEFLECGNVCQRFRSVSQCSHFGVLLKCLSQLLFGVSECQSSPLQLLDCLYQSSSLGARVSVRAHYYSSWYFLLRAHYSML